MLYEMVTGRVPFEADTPLAVIFKHISDPLPLPRDLNPSIPENVEQIILKSLAKNPDDRYQRAVDMVTALVDAVSAETVKSDRKADISKVVIADKTMLSSDPPLESIASPSIQYAPPLTDQPSRLAGISLWVWVIGGVIAVVLLIAIVSIFGFLVMKKAESSTPNTSIVVRAATAPGLVVVSSSTPTTTPMPSPTFTPIPTDTYTPLPPPTNTFTPSPSPTDTPTSTPTPQPPTATPTLFIPANTPTSEPISTPQMNLSQNIDDFENFNISLDGGFEINRNAGNGGQVKLVGIPHVGQGRQALALEFDIQNSPPNHYIGFDRTLPPQDWSDYTSICFWIESDGSNRSLVLQFGESKFKFWKNIYSLSNGTGDYCISLSDPHQINLRSIGYYGVYVEGPPIGQSIIYIDNVRLVKQ